jgi:hypothetical protein
MSMTRDEAVAAVSKYGSIRKASKALHRSDKTISKGLKLPAMGIKSVSIKNTNVKSTNVKSKVTISEHDLLKKTDIETIVLTAIKREIKSLSKAQYMRDSDMKRECRCPDASLWIDMRETKEFHPNVMVVGTNREPMIYWGTSESIKSMIDRGKARKPNWVDSSEEA